MTALERIGGICREYRRAKKITLQMVADCLGTSNQNICDFEHGKNDSATIYQWYINHGLYDDIPPVILPLKIRKGARK